MVKVQIKYDFNEDEEPVIFSGTGIVIKDAFLDAIDDLPLTMGVIIEIIKVEVK